MIWLVSQLWPVALVSVVAGFVITWLSVTRRYDPATDPQRPQRHHLDVDEPLSGSSHEVEGTREHADSTSVDDAAPPNTASNETNAPRQVGIELRSERRPRATDGR